MFRAIRMLFDEYGMVSPYEAYKILCLEMEICQNYTTILTYFHILKKIGLIREAETERSTHGAKPMKLYEIAPGMENHICWEAPKCCYRKEWCTKKQRMIIYGEYS